MVKRSLKSTFTTDTGSHFTIKNGVLIEYWSSSPDKHIVIPYGIKYIGPNAFAKSPAMESITLPTSLIAINESAFRSRKNLKSVKLPDSLKYIDDNAFADCSLLEEINMPKNLEKIGQEAFLECFNLTSIELPEKLKYIGAYAFNGCFDLSKIKIPAGLKEINEGTFYRCMNLQSIVIPQKVKHIYPYAFTECTNLKSVHIKNNRTQVYINAFGGCPCEVEILCEYQTPKMLEYYLKAHINNIDTISKAMPYIDKDRIDALINATTEKTPSEIKVLLAKRRQELNTKTRLQL